MPFDIMAYNAEGQLGVADGRYWLDSKKPPVMNKDALISEDGKYRYWLTRQWADGTLLPFVMLNPSTADADLDDPTIRRCIGFAKREGYSGIYVANLFALRATDPKALRNSNNLVGEDNDEVHCNLLAQCKQQGTPIVCAWGAHGKLFNAGNVFKELCRMWPAKTLCFGTTKDGQPLHPLYQSADKPLIDF